LRVWGTVPVLILSFTSAERTLAAWILIVGFVLLLTWPGSRD